MSQFRRELASLQSQLPEIFMLYGVPAREPLVIAGSEGTLKDLVAELTPHGTMPAESEIYEVFWDIALGHISTPTSWRSNSPLISALFTRQAKVLKL